MKKVRKIGTLVIFAIISILSLITMQMVKINYNLSDYLDEDTETKIALNLIENEFGLTGNIQVLVKNVDTKNANEIKDYLEEIDNVLNVSFDAYDSNYYKNNNALYVVVVDGDDYSENAKRVASDIESKLSYYGSVEYGGTTIEKKELQNGITSEMIYIICISLVLVTIILLITSMSWLEPFVLLFCSLIAVLINRGTNVIFKDVSYITNSISAILQLALSIDYSIVLLHTYKKYRNDITDADEAMSKAVKNVVRPVSASALTTIAGLLALLFMSFKIGFDIGIVLMKGIVISLIVSLTLLPVMIVLFDKLFIKTSKKAFVPKGNFFASFSMKHSLLILIVAVLIISVCAVVQTKNNYIFSDTKSGNEEIIKEFGENNSVIVVYKKNSNKDINYNNEEKLIESITSYGNFLNSYNAYTNTVREEYDLTKIKQKLELSEEEAKLLLAMYNLYKDPNTLLLNKGSFINYANYLIEKDTDANEFTGAETKEMLATIISITDVMNTNNTAKEFYENISRNIKSNNLNEFNVEQMYCLYYYDSIPNSKIDFKTMIGFIASLNNDENMSNYITTEMQGQITALVEGINNFEMQVTKPMTKEELKGYLYQNYSILLSDYELEQIYTQYYMSISEDIKDTIPFLSLLQFLVNSQIITDEQVKDEISNYSKIHMAINSKYDYNEFIDILKFLASSFGYTNDLLIAKDEILQIYIYYFRLNSYFVNLQIRGYDFVNYILNLSNGNEFIKEKIKDNLNDLHDMNTIYNFMNDYEEINYLKMNDALSKLKDNINRKYDDIDLNKDIISGVYIKSYISKNLELANVKAFELLDFVNENKNSNELMIKKLDNNKILKINDANNDVEKAETLFVSNDYSRMILSISLPNEGSETTNFVNYLSKEVKSIFGEEAYITGEMVSVNDLKNSFSHDNIFITIFTIISIFIIVLIIFKSLSLPIVLVSVIQGAIFITMATQLHSEGIFFMSYIVVTCILMGAIIDYGILLSNTYVENRNELDKKHSLVNALANAMPTIFTSGLILTICGFVIHFISSQNSIATVGLLLGIGTISSVIMITIVLPSVLYLLDKFVLKLTAHHK